MLKPLISAGPQIIYDYLSHTPGSSSLEEVMAGTGKSRATCFNHLQTLHQTGMIRKTFKGRLAYYQVDGASVQISMPGIEGVIERRSIGNFLRQWTKVPDLNKWGSLVIFKQFPYLVARTMDFATRWAVDDRMAWPERTELEEVRRGLIDVQRRAQHLADMAEIILESKELWSRKDAPSMWFTDPGTLLSMDEARQIYADIIKLTENSLSATLDTSP